uniref:Palmitoyltransferase n=1 Tax=Panagrolaimus sp. PS1159 TaxID=55785 RepID=A0AC35G1L9_9BILA
MKCCKTGGCCCCCPNFPGRIFAWLIAFFIWYQIFIGVHIGLVSNLGSIFHVVIIIFWNACFLLTISSLFSAALIEPAEIDSKYKVPDEFLESSASNQTISFHRQLSKYANEHPELSFQLVDVGDFKYPRYCVHCQIFKPLRTHHCRTCGKCIPRMDHHCPVIGTCVHFHNHKFFLLFLFWASILCLMGVTFISPQVVYLINTSGEPKYGSLTEVIPAMIVTSGLTNAIVCGLALFCFQMYLWWMLKNNETTLESHEDDEKPDYDLGKACLNIKSIFGKRKYLWFLPIPTTPGNGFTFVQKLETENNIEE